MKIIKLFFTYVVFLTVFSFVSYVIQNTINPSLVYAQVVGCNPPGYCLPSANACTARGLNPVAICDSSTGSMCCEPPTCSVSTVCSYYTPYNTCYNGNQQETCVTTNSNCSKTYRYYYFTVNNCAGPHVCQGGRCVPWCNAGNRYGACDHIGANTTCPPPNNNAYETCTYTRYSGGGSCIQDSCPNRACGLNTCQAPVWGCVAPKCIHYWTVSGTIKDVDGNGTPSIPVACAGHSGLSGGSYTYGYGYKIRAGSYTCTITLPANYIATSATSRGFHVGPNATGINFNVARVFSISGTITDVDGNGTPSIPVTCAGHTARGGPYTFPYADHIRRGTYTCSIALPANYIAIGPTSRTVRVGPDAHNINFNVAEIFTISGNVYDSLNGNAGIPGVTVSTNGGSATTNGAGNYTIGYGARIRRGTHTVTVTVPAGYTNTTSISQSVTVPPNATGINFGLTKLFSITGNVFVDDNIDKLKDNGETNYAKQPVIGAQETMPGVSLNRLQITTNANGTYTINNAVTGNVTVTYQSLPTNYYMTTPLNGPPPSYVVNPGFACSTNGAPGAACVASLSPNGGQDIQNLNFGILDVYPWIQAVCGDIRQDNGFVNNEYTNDSAIISDPSCSGPGIVYTGNTDANFGKGNSSSSQQIVGGFQYPEMYNATGTNAPISYAQLSAKAQNAGLSETSLSSVCTLSNCNLPANLAHGIYYANGDVTLNGFTFPANENYVFIIQGNLTITGDIIVPNTSTVVFAVSGDITIDPNVGVAANSNAPNLEGIYSAGGSFIAQNRAGYCNDLRLNIAGTVIVNAANSGGLLQNDRNLCLNNAWYPAVQVRQRLDFILHLPEFVRTEKSVSQELAP